jgi:hypothetical protein
MVTVEVFVCLGMATSTVLFLLYVGYEEYLVVEDGIRVLKSSGDVSKIRCGNEFSL